jgi:hypothetical protein
VRTELQINSLWHLRRTLEDMSSHESQRRYKAKVPFVHVPVELLEQWSTHIRYLRDTDWFAELFNSTQHAAMEHFDTIIENAVSELPDPIPDIPDVFEHVAWNVVGREAQRLLAVLPRSESDGTAH